MPTQLPRESTDLFAEVLYPHTQDILNSDAKKPLESHNFSYPIYSVSLVLGNQFAEIYPDWPNKFLKENLGKFQQIQEIDLLC